MATKEFPLVPESVAPVKTKYRTICTQIPVPESISLLEKLRDLESRSMGGQPPVIWDRGEDFTIYDPYGNKWLDFSSGVLVTSSGHGRPEIVKAIQEMAGRGMYHAYCFATEIRVKLIEKLTSMLPAPLKRVFLLTTGSEATECCIKLARTRGLQIGGKKKSILVTFENGFHGRTMGAQLAGGSPALKSWLGGEDSRFVQVPFPDGFRQENIDFEVFESSLSEKGINSDDVCGVMSETYQGCNATLMPKQYAQALRKWCDEHKAVLIFDEVQAGFGRTGKPFGFMHYGIVPDLVACGKGLSGGMPASAVLGTDELMDMYGPGEMTSTHSANPICAAAALANLEVIERESLVENAAKLDPVLADGCRRITEASKGKVGHWAAIGLVGALQFIKRGTSEPDPESAWEMVRQAVQKGVMLFAPVGVGGCAIKINPPLTITEDALLDGLSVLEEIAGSLPV
ncbi:MAG: aminotransferase class III-fold pyridoxal phosphate-dependent enzyme [Actinobacteria bacterium]|nr:aminotransferase class III-fold pyridoxal phosphate-dependent enzyme [Actinomycetota bacterium]